MTENIKKTYTKDDFLSCREIAKKFHLAREDVIRANNHSDAYGLRANPLMLDDIVEMVR